METSPTTDRTGDDSAADRQVRDSSVLDEIAGLLREFSRLGEQSDVEAYGGGYDWTRYQRLSTEFLSAAQDFATRYP